MFLLSCKMKITASKAFDQVKLHQTHVLNTQILKKCSFTVSGSAEWFSQSENWEIILSNIKLNFTKPKALQLEQKTNNKPFIQYQKPNRAVLGQTSHELAETVWTRQML